MERHPRDVLTDDDSEKALSWCATCTTFTTHKRSKQNQRLSSNPIPTRLALGPKLLAITNVNLQYANKPLVKSSPHEVPAHVCENGICRGKLQGGLDPLPGNLFHQVIDGSGR